MATRDVTTTVSNALDDSVVYPFFAVEMLFDGDNALRIWTGQGTLSFGGFDWTGAGTLLDVSAIEETSEIAARGATITLSGLPSEVISLALQQPYQGRICNIYFGMFSTAASGGSLILESGDYILLEDGDKILIESELVDNTDLTKIFSGFMDEMNIEESSDTSQIELKVENKLIDLERQRVRRYTSAYQKSIYPGDKGFDFVESLQDKNLVWGR
jgi:hypothetical protein